MQYTIVLFVCQVAVVNIFLNSANCCGMTAESEIGWRSNLPGLHFVLPTENGHGTLTTRIHIARQDLGNSLDVGSIEGKRLCCILFLFLRHCR